VGGAVRDELLGRPTVDFDVALGGEAGRLAGELARALDAHRFKLSEEFGAWRVIARDRSWQVDLTPLLGETLEQDLARRDLTINAIARPLRSGPGEEERLIDPHDGLGDLEARRLRMVGPDSFTEDPLRVMRLARLAAELGFDICPETARAAAAAAAGLGGVAAERVFAELRLILAGDRAPAGLRTMEAIGATAAVLPELTALHGVDQSDYHHLDVHDHTIEVLEQAIALERDPAAVFPEHGQALARLLAEPLGGEATRGQALRFGALFHDIAKAGTRGVTAEGRVTFFGHDRAGAETAVAVLARLRAGDRLAEHVAALCRHHLRLGFLVHEMPLDRRARFRYLSACEPVEVDVTLLSVADRLATRGRNSELAIERHLELARSIMGEALAWRAARPRPPVRGDVLARELGIAPGPELGRLLDQLTEAAYAGEVSGPEEAVAWARGQLQ
jgi:putative nucleotidyltransferase with HDIG domain